MEEARAIEKECLEAGWKTIITNNDTGENIPPLAGAKCMACDLLVGMRKGYTIAEMEKVIVDALAKAGICATVSTVDVVEGVM